MVVVAGGGRRGGGIEGWRGQIADLSTCKQPLFGNSVLVRMSSLHHWGAFI